MHEVCTISTASPVPPHSNVRRHIAQKPLVSIKAGLMTSAPVTEEGGGGAGGSGSRLRLSPDSRRGTLSARRDTGAGGTGGVAVEWRDRASGAVVHSLVLFPGDVVFRRLRGGSPTDRVYELRLVHGARALYFWMQSGDASGDDAAARALIEAVDNPTAAAAAAGAAAGGAAVGRRAAAAATPAVTQDQLTSVLAALRMASFPGGVGSPAAAPTSGTFVPPTVSLPAVTPAAQAPAPAAGAGMAVECVLLHFSLICNLCFRVAWCRCQ